MGSLTVSLVMGFLLGPAFSAGLAAGTAGFSPRGAFGVRIGFPDVFEAGF